MTNSQWLTVETTSIVIRRYRKGQDCGQTDFFYHLKQQRAEGR